jgi:hypothetical protein
MRRDLARRRRRHVELISRPLKEQQEGEEEEEEEEKEEEIDWRERQRE